MLKNDAVPTSSSSEADKLSSTPPTSPRPSSILPSNSSFKGKARERAPFKASPDGPSSHERPLAAVPPLRRAKPSSDLRSFFTKMSPPRKKARMDPEQENVPPRASASGIKPKTTLFGNEKASTRPPVSSTSSFVPALTKSRPKPKPAKLEQLYLDPFSTPGHSTVSCAVCALSYSRTTEDMAFHDKHHKKVVGGCDWIGSDSATKGVVVLDDNVEWAKGKEGGRILMVDALAEGAIGRRVRAAASRKVTRARLICINAVQVRDILETIDTELSSTSLSAEQAVDCKLFLFVTSQRKVVACAVVQRIHEAYEVVLTPRSEATCPLIRFGEEDDGAIFCSSVSRLMGVLAPQLIFACLAVDPRPCPSS